MFEQDTINQALLFTGERLSKAPNFIILQSIESQLLYLKGIFEKTELDRTKISKIIVGLYATREFESSDPEYADLLFSCQNIADQLASKLSRKS